MKQRRHWPNRPLSYATFVIELEEQELGTLVLGDVIVMGKGSMSAMVALVHCVHTAR